MILNFSDDVYPEFDLGVPFRGSYREVFSTDSTEYGGTGLLNTRTLFSRQMDSHMSAEEEAILVISRKPPAASRRIIPSPVSESLTRLTRENAITCGR